MVLRKTIAQVSGFFQSFAQNSEFDGMGDIVLHSTKKPIFIEAAKVRSIVVSEETGQIGYSFDDMLCCKPGIATIISMRHFNEELLFGKRRIRFSINKSGVEIQLREEIILLVAQFLRDFVAGDLFAGLGWYKSEAIEFFDFESGKLKREHRMLDCGRIHVPPLAGSGTKLLPALRYDGALTVLGLGGEWLPVNFNPASEYAAGSLPFLSRFSGFGKHGVLPSAPPSIQCDAREFENSFMLTDGESATLLRIGNRDRHLCADIVEPRVDVRHLGICIGETHGIEDTYTFVQLKNELGGKRVARAVFFRTSAALTLILSATVRARYDRSMLYPDADKKRRPPQLNM